jgi:hypothetical protein
MAVMHVVAGRARREFRHVEEAELDHARRIELVQHRRRHRRAPVAADAAAAGRELALSVIHVLVRHRHAVQRPAALAGGELGVHRLGLRESFLLVDAQEGIHPRLPDLDAGKAGLGRLDGSDALFRDRLGDFAQLPKRQVVVPHERASFAMMLANAAGSSSKVRRASAALRTASFRTSTSAAISASRLSSYFSP